MANKARGSSIWCTLGLHTWSKWSEPIIGQEEVGYILETGKQMSRPTMIQERHCLICNKAQYASVTSKK